MSRIKCKFCDKDYANQENLDKHMKEKHPDKLIEEVEDDELLEAMQEGKPEIPELAELESIAKRFKMTGGFTSKDIPTIDKLFTYFTGKEAFPADCKHTMIYRTQVVVSNFYKK